jgi:flagellar basal body-associated protein FliL
MVPIKDASFVGKKVDCPKCKYRFVVEDPGNLAGNEEEEAAEPKSKVKRKDAEGIKSDKPKSKIQRAEGDGKSTIKKKKKKEEKKSNTMLIVGIVAGVVAVIVLVVGGIFLFSGDSEPQKTVPQQAQKPPVNNSNNNDARQNNTTTPVSSTGNNNTNAANPTGKSGTEPKEAAHAPADKLRMIASNLLPNESQVVYSIHVNKVMGSTLSAGVRSQSGFNPKEFSDKLGLPLEKMGHFVRAENLKSGWVFNVIQMLPNSYSITSDAMKSKLGAHKGPKSPIKGHDYYLVASNEMLDGLSGINFASILNPRIMTPKTTGGQLAWHVYDSNTLIVGDVDQIEQFLQSDRQPKMLSKLTSEAASSLGNGSGAEGNSGAGRAGGGSSGTGAAGFSPPSDPSALRPGGRPAPAGGDSNDDRLFTDKPTYLTINPELKRMLDKMEEAKGPVIFSCGGIDLESVNKQLTDSVRAAVKLPMAIPLPTIVAAGLGLHTLSEDRVSGVAALELRREDDARALDESLKKNFLALAASRLGSWMGTTIDTGIPDSTTSPQGQPPVNNNPGAGRPGAPTIGLPGGRGGSNPGAPSIGNPGNPQGGGGMGIGGTNPPSSTESNAKSKMRAEFLGKLIYITLDAEISQETNRRIYQEIEGQVVRMKGASEMIAMKFPRLHELASTANRLRAKKQILHGTYPLTGDASGVVFVSQSPNQRVSWMVDLLPHLGHEDLYNQIDVKQTWRSEKNLIAGTHWVPEFMDPNYPRDSWTARVPSLPGSELGATHYTGLSGIGLDSAEWPDDPAHRKKLGMFGYDRQTSFDNVPDGLSNTIFLIESPPTFPRPWIAGGGATVQGVPEKNSISPFVYNHGGKQGTYILMCDGSVRWAGADMSDNAFKALVTPAGGDDVGVIDAIAPLIQAPNEAPAKPKSSSSTTSTTSADSGTTGGAKK